MTTTKIQLLTDGVVMGTMQECDLRNTQTLLIYMCTEYGRQASLVVFLCICIHTHHPSCRYNVRFKGMDFVVEMLCQQLSHM